MDLRINLIWMFVGSIIIGLFFNGMNLLAYRFNDLYLSSTLILSAVVMALFMCILEIVMHASAMGSVNIQLISIFSVLTLFAIYLLKSQVLVDDKQWLRRMISHHSTALTTSHSIRNKTRDKKIYKLASDIIDTQEREIALMKQLLLE